MSDTTLQRQHRWFYTLAIFALAVLIAALTFSAPISTLTPGLDNSWTYSLNYLYDHQLLLGRDNFFTFGPLGYLEHTRGTSIAVIRNSLYFWMALIVIMNFCVLMLASITANGKFALLLNGLIALTVLFFLNDGGQRILLALYSLGLLFFLTQRNSVLFIFSLFVAIACCIKFTYAAVAICLLCGLTVGACLKQRRMLPALIAGSVFVMSYSSLWIFVFDGTPLDGLRYFSYGMEYTRGSATAMATYVPTNWLAVLTTIVALGSISFFCFQPKNLASLSAALSFFLVAFIWFKYAYGRFDSSHLMALMNFGFFFGMLALIYNQRWRARLAIIASIALLWFGWQHTHNQFTGTPITLKFNSNKTPMEHWKFSDLFTAIQRLDQQANTTLRLSPAIRDAIGQQAIAIYPWENIFALANQLNWVPMPTLQQYIAYTPKTDQLNARFFASEKAPPLLLWHHHKPAAIDNRHYLSSDPQTVESILTHYQKWLCDSLACLWRKREQALPTTLHKQPQPIVLNQWLPVPQARSVKLHVSARRSLLGKLATALWKETELSIEYQFANGKVKKHRFILENAAYGLWINPYTSEPNALSNIQQAVTVKAVRLTAAQPAFFNHWLGYWSTDTYVIDAL